eukprot:524229_1
MDYKSTGQSDNANVSKSTGQSDKANVSKSTGQSDKANVSKSTGQLDNANVSIYSSNNLSNLMNMNGFVNSMANTTLIIPSQLLFNPNLGTMLPQPMLFPVVPQMKLSDCVQQQMISSMILIEIGSRFIQANYLNLTLTDRENLCNQVLCNDVVWLCKHPYANWIIRLICEYGNIKQTAKITTCFTGHVLDLTCNVYAHKVIENIFHDRYNFERVTQEKMLKELHGKAKQCLNHRFGCAVIQTILQWQSPVNCMFILNEFRSESELMELACDPSGNYVFQLILEKFRDNQSNDCKLMKFITKNLLLLSKNQSGNHVVQTAIETTSLDTRNKMFEIIFDADNFVQLSNHKYASYVVEMTLPFLSMKNKTNLVTTLVDAEKEYDISMLSQLQGNRFGNYIVQKLLSCLQFEDKKILLEQIWFIVNSKE